MEEKQSLKWSHPRLVAAVAEENWSAVFRIYRKLFGISQTRLGGRVGLAQSDVSDIERGRRRVTSGEVRQRIIDGLEIPSALLSTDERRVNTSPVPSLIMGGMAPDADLLSRVTSAVNGQTRVDVQVLDFLDRLLAEHRKAEDLTGSRPLVGIIRQQLRTVLDLQVGVSRPLLDRVIRLASEHSQFIAWMAQDQGESAAALAWYDRSHEWALEAGDPNMAATALSMKAHLAWSGGLGTRCVRLADAARCSSPGASRGVSGMAAQMAARGHALNGDASLAHRLMDDAEALVRSAAERPEDEPPWTYFYGENWFRLQRGMAEIHLANWRTSVDLLADGVAALPDYFRRDKAWYRSCLSHAHAGAGEASQALSVALECLPDAAAVGRPHSWNELHATASLLLRKGASEGRELVNVLKDFDKGGATDS